MIGPDWKGVSMDWREQLPTAMVLTLSNVNLVLVACFEVTSFAILTILSALGISVSNDLCLLCVLHS